MDDMVEIRDQWPESVQSSPLSKAVSITLATKPENRTTKERLGEGRREV